MNKIKINITLFVVFLLIFGGYYLSSITKINKEIETIKVGILHSLTGNLAFSEIIIVNSTLFAIDEFNKNSNILGKKIVPVIRDGKSDPQEFAKQAEALIIEDNVDVIFGIKDPQALQAVKPILEKHNKLLFYPGIVIGFELGPNIYATGGTLNQLFLPVLKMFIDQNKKTFYFVGSDSPFSKITALLCEKTLSSLDTKLLKSSFIPKDFDDFKEIFQEIKDLKPDVIINCLLGISNIDFFSSVDKLFTEKPFEIVSFTLNSSDKELIKAKSLINSYVTNTYFFDLDLETNQLFKKEFQAIFSKKSVINSDMINAYTALNLWAIAANYSGSVDSDNVKKNLKHVFFDSPLGVTYFDSNLPLTWKKSNIVKINNQKKYDFIWRSERDIPPLMYPLAIKDEANLKIEINKLLNNEGYFHEK
jgi:urea transport system substrate-binding protein